MGLPDVGTRIEDQNPSLYLGIGVLSLLKAGLLRRVGRSAKRDLREAVLFIGVGLALRSYQRRRTARDEGEAGASEGTDGTRETEDTENGREREDEPATDEPVVVAGPDERDERGTDGGGDRGQSSVPDVVAAAVGKMSPP